MLIPFSRALSIKLSISLDLLFIMLIPDSHKVITLPMMLASTSRLVQMARQRQYLILLLEMMGLAARPYT